MEKSKTDATVLTTKVKKAVFYGRYSSNNQTENSIAYQRAAVYSYAELNNIQIVEDYVDEAKTGTNALRPAFQQMIKDMQQGPEWRLILVYDRSRAFRNASDAMTYDAMWEDMGFRMIAVTQEFEETPSGQLSKRIIDLLNAFYSEDNARKTHAGMTVKAKKAKYLGGKVPFGYEIDKNKDYVIKADEAEIVKDVFQWYEEGISYSEIAEQLNRAGKTRRGKPFTRYSFFDMLHQSKYYGNYQWNKALPKKVRNHGSHSQKAAEKIIVLPDSIPAIITKEQFERVQKRMNERAKGKALKPRTFYLLSNLDILWCGKCKARMQGLKRTSHGRKYTTYACPNHHSKQCDNREINASALDRYVIKIVVHHAFDGIDMDELAAGLAGRELQPLLEEKRRLENEIRNLIATAAMMGPSEAITQTLQEKEKRKEVLQAEIESMRAQGDLLKNQDKAALEEKLITYLSSSQSAEVRTFIAERVKKIVVGDTDIEVEVKAV